MSNATTAAQAEVPIQPEVPITMRRRFDRTIFVFVGNMILIGMFIVGFSVGLQYLSGGRLALGGCVIIMLYYTTIRLFFFGRYKKYLATVADLCGAVLTNRNRGTEAPNTDVEALTLRKTRALEEIGSGIWNWKFPWQGVIYVDLRREAEMGTEITAYASDGPAVKAKWAGMTAPIPGFLCNLVRNTPQAGHVTIQSTMNAALSETLNGMPWEDISQNQSELKGVVAKTFNGDNNATPLEQSLGVGAKKLRLESVIRGDKVQEDAELPERAEKLALAVKKLKKLAPGLSDKEALQAILAKTGAAEFVAFQGLEQAGEVQKFLNVRGGKGKGE